MGECDAVLCGTVGKYQAHLRHVADVIGQRSDAPVFAAMNGLLLPKPQRVHLRHLREPQIRLPSSWPRSRSSRPIGVRRFGLVPKVALLSHSNFGSDDSRSARKMREARRLLAAREPELEMDGEMHGDAALSEAIRSRVLPDSKLKGEANLLIMPNLDAANISFNLLKITGGEGDHDRPDTAGCAQAGADRNALGHRPTARQPDGARRRRGGFGRLVSAADGNVLPRSKRFGTRPRVLGSPRRRAVADPLRQQPLFPARRG